MKNLICFIVLISLSCFALALDITKWDFEGSSLTPVTGSGSLSRLGGVTHDTFNGGYGGSALAWSTTSYPAQGTNNQTAGIMIELSSLGYNSLNFSTSAGPIGSALTAGALAFVEYGTDSPDRFSFVLLRDVLENTKISFTDKAWDGSAFAASEDVYLWRATGRAFLAGEVIHIVEGISFADEGLHSPDFGGFSNSGDQIIAFQGDPASPAFIAAFSTWNWLETGTPTTNTSYLPSSLTPGTNALSFSTEIDNGVYTGTTNGTATSLLTQINAPENWVRANSQSGVTYPDWLFQILSAPEAPQASIDLLDDSTLRITWDAVPGAVSYSVYEASDPYSTFSLLLSSLTSTYADIPLGGNPSTRHYYRIVANN